MDKEQQDTLREQLSTLQEQACQYETLLDDLLGKLAKADALRVSEPEKRSHWNRVLDHLEESLDMIKSRQGICQLKIEQISKELDASPS